MWKFLDEAHREELEFVCSSWMEVVRVEMHHLTASRRDGKNSVANVDDPTG
jgi:hypothetical protein